MTRVVAIVAIALTLGACSGSSMPSFELPRSTPAATTLQFESEPAGAEARTSQGQTCRTPCSVAVAANEFTVTFTHPGFQPQSVPVRVVTSNEPPDPATGEVAAPRLVPNPVYVELQPAAAPPASGRNRRPPPKPSQAQTQSAPRPAAAASRPAAAPRPVPTVAPTSPAPAPASPWPPVTR